MSYTTIRVDKEDAEWLEDLREKMRKRGIGDVVHSMIELIQNENLVGGLR